MLTKEDAERANELYNELSELERATKIFQNAQDFDIGFRYGETRVPVETSIAKQIAFKYLGDKSYNVRQQLADMGFTWEKKPNEK